MKQKKGISKWLYYFLLGTALILVYKFVSDFSTLCEIVKELYQ